MITSLRLANLPPAIKILVPRGAFLRQSMDVVNSTYVLAASYYLKVSCMGFCY
jgi:hypothetical protein